MRSYPSDGWRYTGDPKELIRHGDKIQSPGLYWERICEQEAKPNEQHLPSNNSL